MAEKKGYRYQLAKIQQKPCMIIVAIHPFSPMNRMDDIVAEIAVEKEIDHEDFLVVFQDASSAWFAYDNINDLYIPLVGAISEVDALKRWLEIKKEQAPKVTPLELSKGRSEDYYLLTPKQQWEQDNRLGLLFWNGKE